MELICLEDAAFYALLDKVYDHLMQKQGITEDKWISGPEAMKKLRIKSKATLQKMRDEGVIRFSQPEKKIILYDTDSINEYLAKHSKATF
ncbi:MAG TPA: helix-turn-helix domain-containing protein [Puia sp.]|nr:helix-turn-helix domain-containing protein [Puia sp.]